MLKSTYVKIGIWYLPHAPRNKPPLSFRKRSRDCM